MEQILNCYDAIQLRVIGSLVAANTLQVSEARERIVTRCANPDRVMEMLCDEVIVASNRQLTRFFHDMEVDHAFQKLA